MFGSIEDFPWHPDLVHDMATDADDIDEQLSLCVLAEACPPEEQQRVQKVLTEAAAEIAAKAKAAQGEKDVELYFAKGESGPVGQIRQLTTLPSAVLPHEHPLEKQPGGENTWQCDGCGRPGGDCTERHNCKGCEFDYCEPA